MSKHADVITDEQLARVVAKSEIQDVLYRYCHACDRGDIGLLKTCYHPGAIDEHGVFSGDAADYADFIIPSMNSRFAMSQHHMSNILIELYGDTAYVETYFLSFHRWKDDFTKDNTAAGRYIDRFEQRDGRWLIAHRQVVMDWTALSEGIDPIPNASVFNYGSRDKADHSYFRLPHHAAASWGSDR